MEVDCAPKGSVVLRRAVAGSGDAERISTFGAKAFIDTFLVEFQVPYPEADLKVYMEESYAASTFEKWLNDPKFEVWVADAPDGSVAGYCASGPCTLPHEEVTEANGELYKLYLGTSYFGTGLAQALYDRADEFLKTAYKGPRYLSVWSENIRAQRFYQRQGYEFLSEYEYPVGAHRDREFIFRSKD